MPWIRCACTGWCITYPVQPGEFHHRDCKDWNRQHRGAEVFQTRTELIVTGDPGEDENHNCDAMGCTSVSHVLFRFPLPLGVTPTQAPSREPVAWMHVQGNHFEPSLRQLDDGEKARGWTQFPLYGPDGVKGPQHG